MRDAHSRYVLALKAVPGTSEKHVRPVFEELFKKWGLLLAIQSDNGAPFASVLVVTPLHANCYPSLVLHQRTPGNPAVGVGQFWRAERVSFATAGSGGDLAQARSIG